MKRGEVGEGVKDYLFWSEGAKWISLYKLYACSILGAIVCIWFYRATHVPRDVGRWAWLGLFAAEVWFGIYWIITQSVRWNPVYHHTHKAKLRQRYGSQLPKVDIFVCTADPVAEPPTLVMSTVLSVMAYKYAPEKLSVYLSDDACSILTFYALWETSRFAKHWLPYCKRFNIEPRSPQAYFSKSYIEHEISKLDEWNSTKKLYEDMTERIDGVVASGKIPEELLKEHKGFAKWNSEMTPRNHPPIVQIVIDGRDKSSYDLDGNPLPTLVYMAREKRPQHHHNFKAGAMNALIRVSSEISNAPLILNLDCDMYSNNSASIEDALCFFLDERSHDVAYVQYPQYFSNVTKNDLYASSFNVVNEVEHAGVNNWGGPLYIGTGCFHRRESLLGRKYSREYEEDWTRGVANTEKQESVGKLEERAESLIECSYENNTLWGKELGLKYGCPVEDVITGLTIQCRRWRSFSYNPSRRGFLGFAPTTLQQTLVQHKRWSEGNLQIALSKHSPFIQGYGKIQLGLEMAYSVYGLWALNSFPTLYYLVIPPLCLLKGISLYPNVCSPWFAPFAYVFIAKHIYGLVESLLCGDTFIAWWNSQRMWVFKRLTSYLYATSETILKILGLSKLSFAITTKVADKDVSKRYEQEVMEFGPPSAMLTIIATIAMLNVNCLFGGLVRLALSREEAIGDLLAQSILCALVVGVNMPTFGAMLFRKDKGSLHSSTILTSFCLASVASLMPTF